MDHVEPGTRRRWPKRVLALVALVAAGAGGLAAFSAATPAQPERPSTAGATAGDRLVVVRTNRTRRVVVVACGRSPGDVERVRDARDGDAVLTLRAGTGPRVLRVAGCASSAIRLDRPAVAVLPLGAAVADADPFEVGRRLRARTVVIGRCAGGSVPVARRPEPGATRRLVRAPACR